MESGLITLRFCLYRQVHPFNFIRAQVNTP
jgi:hypothetical protein